MFSEFTFLDSKSWHTTQPTLKFKFLTAKIVVFIVGVHYNLACRGEHKCHR